MNTFDDKRWVTFSSAATQQERAAEEIQYGAITSLTYRPTIAGLYDFSVESGFDFQYQDNKSFRYLTKNRVRTSQT